MVYIKANHPDATVPVFEGLNHLFRPADTGAPSGYSAIETTLSNDVFESVSEWIVEKTME